MGDTCAAIDLGSNSFHLVIARLHDGGHLDIVDRHKEQVRLAAGLDSADRLTEPAQRRAIACLERFRERLEDIPARQIRVVGTNTLRVARNRTEFLRRAEAALGHPVAVISGREEARLIYQGVMRDHEGAGRTLVVDIGGGSTELALGVGGPPELTDSLYMGCVSWTRRFFRDGRVDPLRRRQAVDAARLELRSVRRQYRDRGWQVALGSSGTIKALDAVLLENNMSLRGITAEGLERLWRRIFEAGGVDRLTLVGLSENRRDVIIGGLAVLTGVFESLHLQAMTVSASALREGLLVDLIGRSGASDTREATVGMLLRRAGADPEQSARVADAATELMAQVAEPWGLTERHGRLLRWAGRLHEIGRSVAFSGHHKHGAYLIAHSDLPGFSREEQRLVAALVLGHRGKLSAERLIEASVPYWDPSLFRLVALLRISVMLHRGRSGRPKPPLVMEADGPLLSLRFPEGTLNGHPLTRLDLGREVAQLRHLGFMLAVG